MMARRLTKQQLYRKFRKERFGKGCFGGFCQGLESIDTVVDTFESTAAKNTALGKGVRKFAKAEKRFRKKVCGQTRFGEKNLRRSKIC
jgi:hypothetical protein